MSKSIKIMINHFDIERDQRLKTKNLKCSKNSNWPELDETRTDGAPVPKSKYQKVLTDEEKIANDEPFSDECDCDKCMLEVQRAFYYQLNRLTAQGYQMVPGECLLMEKPSPKKEKTETEKE